MRGTLIVYAHPETFRLMARHQKRFYGHRESFRDRLYAAWLVFTGRADALSWEEWPHPDDAEQISPTARHRDFLMTDDRQRELAGSVNQLNPEPDKEPRRKATKRYRIVR